MINCSSIKTISSVRAKVLILKPKDFRDSLIQYLILLMRKQKFFTSKICPVSHYWIMSEPELKLRFLTLA